MRNEISGLDQTNNRLWEAREITEEGGQPLWLGTAHNLSGLVIHVDLRNAITFFMMQCPETDTINAILADRFRMSIPSRAAAVTIIDVILKDLEVADA